MSSEIQFVGPVLNTGRESVTSARQKTLVCHLCERCMKRRALLGISAGAFVGFAGCSALGSNAETTPSPKPLPFIGLQNWNEESHTLDVLVRRDGEIVHWEQYDLQAAGTTDDGTTLKASGEQIPAGEFDGCISGAYVIDFRLDDEQRNSVEPSRRGDHGFLIEVREDGGLTHGYLYYEGSGC